MQSAEQLVLDLSNPDLRENALLELSKEIVSIYPVLSPPNLTPAQSNRVCNALALLQCVASHRDTRMLFLNGCNFHCAKILLDDVGLDYICTTAERFYAVARVLGNMVGALAEQPSSRLLKHIIRCYLRLSDNPRACDALRSCLPDMLRDTTFSSCLREDPTTRRWLQQLLHNVSGNRVALQAGGFDHMLVN
ncbi:unnamed protein product [Withania somnifera]